MIYVHRGKRKLNLNMFYAFQNEDMQLSLSLEKASKSEDNETIKKPLSLEATEKGIFMLLVGSYLL